MRILLSLIAVACFAAGPLPPGAKPTKIGDIGAGEGPAWHPEKGLFFTGGNRITQRDPQGRVTVFRDPAGGANGLLIDPQMRLVTCEGTARRVTRTDPSGSITVLADNYQGKRFNSPNDLTIDSKGRLYFSDPRYGNRTGMEMAEAVYRIDAPGKVTRVLSHVEVDRPNGLLVSPGDRFLYVADNNNNRQGTARKLWRFSLRPDGSVDAASKHLVFDWKSGRGPDGIKMDREGRLFVAAGRNQANSFETADEFKGGVYVLSPEGKLLEFIPIPVDEVTNCAFGGPDLKTLFISAGGTLWEVPVTAQGRVPYLLR
jgi:gluconolactonase